MLPYQGLSDDGTNTCSLGKFSFTSDSWISESKLVMEFVKTSSFLLLGVVNSRFNSWIIMI
jgi:hypothetical protein